MYMYSMNEFASCGRPHDRLARNYFGNETAMRRFLEDFLPPEMSAALDYASLESRKESYISENLRESITDLVFECRLRNGDPGSVYLLFEAKHNPEHLCALQVLRYMLALWEEAVAKNSGLRKLPFVLPIVFYHGKRAWNGRQMRELFTEDTPFSTCIPDFSMRIFNLADVPEEDLKGDFVRNAMLLLLKAVNDALPARKIAEAFRLLESALDDDIMRTLRLFINYLEQSRPDITPDALLKEMERLPQGETTMQTFMERFSELAYQRGMLIGETQGLAEGKAQGLAAGKAQGLAEGKAQGEMKALRETLIDLLADRFGAPPVDLVEHLERMESSLALRSLIRAIPTTESLEVFQALLGNAPRKQ